MGVRIWANDDAVLLRDQLVAAVDPVLLTDQTNRLGDPAGVQVSNDLLFGDSVPAPLADLFRAMAVSAFDAGVIDGLFELAYDLADVTGARRVEACDHLDAAVVISQPLPHHPPAYTARATTLDIICDLLTQPLSWYTNTFTALASTWLKTAGAGLTHQILYRTNAYQYLEARIEVLICNELGFSVTAYDPAGAVVNLP